ncbi:MAG TPA: galactokinase [Mycobacteriales bacterium]|nr:galactokinase [Mycobacteriales bacterium]
MTVTELGDFAVDEFGADFFQSVFGREAETVWAAPGRVNVIGEHTDYNDGFALPIAIPLRTVTAIARRSDDALRMVSRQLPDETTEVGGELRPGAVSGWAAYVAGAVWALREAGVKTGGFDIAIDGQVPVGSGLSSSAALECGVACAVAELSGAQFSRADLTRLTQRSENEFVGAPTGNMDQTASLRCTEKHALLLDSRTLEVTQVPFDLRGEGLALLVINTRAPHSHVDGEYAARRRSCEYAADQLGVQALRDLTEADLGGGPVQGLDEVTRRRVNHVVTENARVLRTVELLQDGRIREIGPLLTASHASLRDDYEVSIPQLDTAVDSALDAGAYGARMTGGGFGGCAIALADADRVDAMQAAISEAYAARGFTTPEFFVVLPAQGAQRLA